MLCSYFVIYVIRLLTNITTSFYKTGENIVLYALQIIIFISVLLNFSTLSNFTLEYIKLKRNLFIYRNICTCLIVCLHAIYLTS